MCRWIHDLAAVLVAIDDESKAVFVDAFLLRDVARHDEHVAERAFVIVRTSLTVGIGLLGTISTCTGACGLMSRNAVTRSSLCTMVDGISPAMIFSKIVAMCPRLVPGVRGAGSTEEYAASGRRVDRARNSRGAGLLHVPVVWLWARHLAHNPRLEATLRHPPLAPLWVSPPGRTWLSGDEALLVGEAADAIRARARRAGFEEREVYFIERVADWDDGARRV